jgi:hypothetical protein
MESSGGFIAKYYLVFNREFVSTVSPRSLTNFSVLRVNMLFHRVHLTDFFDEFFRVSTNSDFSVDCF